MALDDQSLEVRECRIRPGYRDLLRLHQTSHDLRDFDVDEMRCVQTLRRMQCASSDALRSRRLQHEFHRGRSVEYDQRASRSSRST